MPRCQARRLRSSRPWPPSAWAAGFYGIGTPGGQFAFYPNGYGLNNAPPITFGSELGSGANAPGGGGGGGSSAAAGPSVGYGATVSSGFGTSLNAQNSYGMGPSTSSLGQTTSAGSEVPTTGAAPSNSGNDSSNQTPPPPAPTNPPALGVNPSASNNLLQGVITTTPSLGVNGR